MVPSLFRSSPFFCLLSPPRQILDTTTDTDGSHHSTNVQLSHLVQGMSKDTLIINSWGCGFENWVCVVLSRVWTRPGLVLNAKLDLHKKFKVPEKLLKLEERMKEREKKYSENYHGRSS